MPHLIDTYEGERAKTVASTAAPIGPGFPAEIVEQLAKLEVWGSDMKDAGPGYCKFVAFDAADNELRVRTIQGH